MSKLLEQFWQDAQAFRLSDSERADMRATLQLKLFSTAPEGELVGAAATLQLHKHEHAEGRRQLQEFMRTYQAPSPSWGSSLVALFSSRLLLASTAAFALVIVATGGVAEAALPGDMLYPVKIYVTEPIRETLARTPEAERAWQVHRLDRRLVEQERLERTGRLTAERREELEFLIDVQTYRIEAHLDALPAESNDPDIEEFRMSLTHVLEERQAVIDSIVQERVLPEEIAPVLQDARGRREAVEEQNRQRRERFERIRARLDRTAAAGTSVPSAEAQPPVQHETAPSVEALIPEDANAAEEEEAAVIPDPAELPVTQDTVPLGEEGIGL